MIPTPKRAKGADRTLAARRLKWTARRHPRLFEPTFTGMGDLVPGSFHVPRFPVWSGPFYDPPIRIPRFYRACEAPPTEREDFDLHA